MEKEETKDVELEQELEDLYRKVASTDLTEDSSDPLQQSETGTAAPEDPGLPECTQDNPLPRKEGSTHRLLLMATGVFFIFSFLFLIAIFFWPTIYYYESLNLGKKVYPMRINKITGEASYYNGTSWSSPPVTEAVKKTFPINLNDPSAIIPPETSVNKTPTDESTAAPAPLNTLGKEKYVIQIKAFPESKKKEALAFMEKMKKHMPDIHMKTVHIAGHGVWYRILVGSFASTSEASNSMKKLMLSDSYPDSFIRMQSR